MTAFVSHRGTGAVSPLRRALVLFKLRWRRLIGMELGAGGLGGCAVRLFSRLLLLAPGGGRALPLRRKRLNPDPAIANLCREDLQIHLGGTMSNPPATNVEARAVPGAL